MTFVVRADGDEPSTMHTLQLEEERKCGYFLGGRLRGVRSRAQALNAGHSIGRGFEVVVQVTEPRCTSGYCCEYTRNTEDIFLSVGLENEVDREQFVYIFGIGEDGVGTPRRFPAKPSKMIGGFGRGINLAYCSR